MNESDLNVAINTYMLIVLEIEAYEIFEERGLAGNGFYIDPYEYPLVEGDYVVDALEMCLEIFIENEHYEKCQDIKELLKEIK